MTTREWCPSSGSEYFRYRSVHTRHNEQRRVEGRCPLCQRWLLLRADDRARPCLFPHHVKEPK